METLDKIKVKLQKLMRLYEGAKKILGRMCERFGC